MLCQQPYFLRRTIQIIRAFSNQFSVWLWQMITTNFTKILISIILLISNATQVNAAETPDWDSIANKVVNHALNIQAGETVIITGGPKQIELLEALQVATSKSGGLPVTELDLPNANMRSLLETPLEYLGQPPLYVIQQMRFADAFIDVRSIQDPDLYSNIPEERFVADRRSTSLITQAIKRAHFRQVTLGQTGGIPTKPFADSQGANYNDMLAMFWNALDVDYDELRSSANNISKKLKPRSTVHLTTESGTNLTFRIGNSTPRLNTGRTVDNIMASGASLVWLPAGEAYVCTQPSSASGTLVIPHLTFRGISVTNIVMEFENGRLTKFEGDKNAKKIKQFLDSAKGDIGVLSVVDIGLNPKSTLLKGSTFVSYEMGGMTTLGIGNSSWAGCEVESDAGLSLYVTGSTFTIDGEVIIEKGNLKK
jgi:leucyl aminopeptidase (aminopeptidase T)